MMARYLLVANLPLLFIQPNVQFRIRPRAQTYLQAVMASPAADISHASGRRLTQASSVQFNSQLECDRWLRQLHHLTWSCSRPPRQQSWKIYCIHYLHKPIFCGHIVDLEQDDLFFYFGWPTAMLTLLALSPVLRLDKTR
ncbi:hypothetical protein LZ32DRAFT_413935 [Colletotrichum eremochloae]|nr:hypothetical protein LZ32DRAFT_413935 [Colletotrichum eremochloae]